MKNLIRENLENAKTLEKLYRQQKDSFTENFRLLYPEIAGNPLAEAWNERLNFEKDDLSFGSAKDLIFILFAALLAGVIAKLPDLIGLKPDYYYPRHLGFIVFPFLTAYFIRKNNLTSSRILISVGIITLSALYINLLPENNDSDTFILAAIHLPLVLWSVTGLAYLGKDWKSSQKRISFLKFNGELLVLSAIIVLAGLLLSGITISLFKIIGMNIENFYVKHIAIWGAAAIPIVAAFLSQTNPQLVNKVSPLIAKVFTPLVLIMLVIYLIAILVQGKDPYNDREFLLIFNLLLIGVMAIILFSVSESSSGYTRGVGRYLLLSLSFVTIIINLIALSAILFRIGEWGITPNRLAVLGSNVLILINLIQVNYRLYQMIIKKQSGMAVENSIASFLPYYAAWAILVTFTFPLMFGFR